MAHKSVKLIAVLVSCLLLFGALGYKLLSEFKEREVQEVQQKKLRLNSVPDLFDVQLSINLIPTANHSILHIFQTSCSCAKNELQELEKIAAHYNVIGLVWSNDAKTATRWLQEHGNHYAQVGLLSDKDAVSLGLVRAPLTLIVDTHGSIVLSLQGPLTLEALRSGINNTITQQTLPTNTTK